MALRQVAVELDAVQHHIGRRRDDAEAADDRALCGRQLDLAAAAGDIDELDRGVELHRNALGELGQQRAVALAADRGGVAAVGAAEIDRRDVTEVLAREIGAERKLHGGLPLAEVLRHRAAGARIVALCARCPASRGWRAPRR